MSTTSKASFEWPREIFARRSDMEAEAAKLREKRLLEANKRLTLELRSMRQRLATLERDHPDATPPIHTGSLAP